MNEATVNLIYALVNKKVQDFKKDNRRKFISKIATNDFDAVIMSHSSFEKIKISIQKNGKK